MFQPRNLPKLLRQAASFRAYKPLPCPSLRGGAIGPLQQLHFELPTFSVLNQWQATVQPLFKSNSSQLSRFSSVASPEVNGKDSNSSADEPGQGEEKVEPVSMSQPPPSQVGEELGSTTIVSDKEAATSEAKLESDDETSQEEEDLLGLLGEKEALLEQKDKVIAELKDRLLRTLAEAENVSNRARRDAESTKKYAIQNFAKGLLDVADNLERAAATVPESIQNGAPTDDSTKILKTLLEGVEMTQKQLMQVFNKHGVEKFDPDGQPFDPNQHLALFEVQDPNKSPGTIATVLKSGYMLHDRVIRPAEVGVVKQES